MISMRLQRLCLATLVLGGVFLIVGGVAEGAAPGEQHRGQFTLYEHDTTRQGIDLGDAGFSVGDLFVFGGNVSDRQGGPTIGRMAGQCTNTSDSEILCTAAFTLDGGQITFQGIVDTGTFFGGRPVDFAVTGGTGPYRNARGILTGRILPEPPDGSDAQFIVRLN